MPPRASVRRSTRISSREPESRPPGESPGSLQKLQLPALHGTPSSRRLYSYGSGVEPPQRPGHGLQKGQLRDIGNAVQNALTRHQKETEDEEPVTRPSRSNGRAAADEDDADELANDNDAASRRTQRPRIGNISYTTTYENLANL